MAIPNPKWKSVRPRAVGYLRDFRNRWQTGHGKLDPCGSKYCGNDYDNADENGRTDPDTKTAVFRNVDRPMCYIEINHTYIDS